jgi:hypothetical protein
VIGPVALTEVIAAGLAAGLAQPAVSAVAASAATSAAGASLARAVTLGIVASRWLSTCVLYTSVR